MEAPISLVGLDVTDGSSIWSTRSGVQTRRRAESINGVEDIHYPGPMHIATGQRWIACGVGKELYLLDRRTGKQAKSIHIGGQNSGPMYIAAGQRWIACGVGKELYLLDSRTGRQAKGIHIRGQIVGATWSDDSSLVLCVSDEGAKTMHAEILRPETGGAVATIPISLKSASGSTVSVVGDVVLINSSESVAVDLKQKRELWHGPWRRYIVSGDAVYYDSVTWKDAGGHEASFGTCDPRTGNVTVLYSETFSTRRTTTNPGSAPAQ